MQASAIGFEIDDDEIVKAVVTVEEKMAFQSVQKWMKELLMGKKRS
jgi:hypothetical protein